MKLEEIATALRCISTVGDKEQHCESCPFYKTGKLDAEQAEKLGVDEWPSCDCDEVGLAAADLIEKLLDRCARYAEEIAVLRERQRWIPVTERLPVGDDQVLVVASGKPRENIELVHAAEIASLYDDGWCLETWPEWTGAIVTHWMPLPEAPEEER